MVPSLEGNNEQARQKKEKKETNVCRRHIIESGEIQVSDSGWPFIDFQTRHAASQYLVIPCPPPVRALVSSSPTATQQQELTKSTTVS